MRIPLLRGRNFTEQEVRQSDKVIVVSQAFVDSVFPNEEALGKRLIIWPESADEPYEIIGIVGDIRHRSLRGPSHSPTMYMPTRQAGWIESRYPHSGRSVEPCRWRAQRGACAGSGPANRGSKTMNDWVSYVGCRTALSHNVAWAVCGAGDDPRRNWNLRCHVLLGRPANTRDRSANGVGRTTI